nr:hypothetical protein [uncultured Desulfobacter sp.]
MPRTMKSTEEVKGDTKPKTVESKDESGSKSKAAAPVANVKAPANKANVKKQAVESTETNVTILSCEKCNKLTTRGVGQLEYEIGIDQSGNAFIRIVSCGSSGTFSKNWISVDDIKKIIDGTDENGFRAIILSDLYKSRSANNPGFMGAVLKHLGVFTTEPERPTLLYLESWEPLMKKIDSLKSGRKV